MMLISTFVAPSDVEGVGVFAAQPVKKGDLIWRLDTTFDRLIHVNDIPGLPEHMQEFLRRYAYPFHNDTNVLVFEVDNGRFMNHSEQPNSRFDEVTLGYATRDIDVGEEITCNYREFDPAHTHLPSLTPLKRTSNVRLA